MSVQILERDVAGAEGEGFVEGQHEVGAGCQVGGVVQRVESGDYGRQGVRGGGAEQVDHAAAEGVADEHEGFGVPVVVEALAATGNRRDGRVAPESSGFHGFDVADEVGIFHWIVADGELGVDDGPAGGVLVEIGLAPSFECGGGDDEGGFRFDFSRVAGLVIGADLPDELGHVLLITVCIRRGAAEAVIPALEPGKAGDFETHALKRLAGPGIIVLPVVEHAGDGG